MATVSSIFDEHYSNLIARMHREFSFTTSVLEEKVQALTHQNALLSADLQQAHKQRDILLQRVDQATAEAKQLNKENKTLKKEMKPLQRHLDMALVESTRFEKRTTWERQGKKMVLAELEIETEEQELPSTSTWKSVESTFAARPAVSTATEAARVLPSAARMMKMKTKTIKAEVKQPVKKLKMAMLAYQEDKKTSPVSTAETGKDGVQFPRSMRFVTVRRPRSSVSDDIDSRCVTPQPAARLQGKFPTHKSLRRDVNGLRQKLDSCMVKAAWR